MTNECQVHVYCVLKIQTAVAYYVFKYFGKYFTKHWISGIIVSL